MRKNRTGEKFKNYQGYEVEIIDYIGSMNCTIQFNDVKKTIRYNVAVKELQQGSVKNFNHPQVLGVGYMGIGNYTARVNRKMSKCYRAWFNMLSRCYESSNVRNQNYINVTVCDEWHNFQNFAEWYYKNYTSEKEGWCVDKDLLSPDPNYKVYSPETCCLIPNEVNVLFSTNEPSKTGLPRGVYPKDGKYQAAISKFGKQVYLGFYDTVEESHEVYTQAKKQYIKEVAEKWKDLISEKVYNAIKDYDINLL